MDIRIDLNLAAQVRQFQQWGIQAQAQLYAAAAEGMRTAGAQIGLTMQAHVASRLQTKRRGFVTSFRHRVYARDKRRPPLLILGSSIPWIGLHERGGSIAGRMLAIFAHPPKM